MRIFAIHDAEGIISEVITCPDDSPVPVLQTQPGFSMTEIEPPKDLVETEFQSSEGVTKLVESYRVQVAPRKSTLASR
jgi:hypothetical protein